MQTQIQTPASVEATALLSTGKVLGESKFSPAIRYNEVPIVLQWEARKSKSGNEYASSQISVNVNGAVKTPNVFGPFGKSIAELTGVQGYITVSKATVKTEFAELGDNQFGFELIAQA